jgi:hypothetical protein
MPVVAKQIGLEPLESKPVAWFNDDYLAKSVGKRICIGSSKQQDLANAVFIGAGSANFRGARTVLSSPFLVGQHGTAEECQIKFAERLADSRELQREVAKLCGRAVACECALEQPCHGDVILAWSSSSDAEHEYKAKSKKIWRRPPLHVKALPAAVLVAAKFVGTQALAVQVPLRFPQCALDRAIRNLFPLEYTQGVKVPCAWRT